MKVVADEDIDMQATRIKLTAVNGLDINAGAIDINGKTNLNMTSPMVKFNGTKCEFSMNSVVVDNTFQLIKGGTYTMHDPFAKCSVIIQDGVVTGVQFW